MGKKSREKKEKMLQFSGQEAVVEQKRSRMERICFLIIEWGVYLALFAPLIFGKGFFFPFVAPKTLFFRIIVDFIFIAYILLVVSNRRYLPKLNALTISVAAFLGVLTLTSFTGVNLAKSFWSVFERMTGLLTFLHLFAFFVVLAGAFKERKYWERIFMVSVFVGLALGVFVLAKDNLSPRGGGTIGNVSFMAAYLLFDIFFAIAMLFAKAGFWRIFYGIAALIMILTLFFSPELPRGGIGAFIVGIFLLILGYMIFSKKKILKRLAPIVLVSTILLVLAASQTGFFKSKMMAFKELPGEARKLVWQIGFESWQDRPWLGWGIENFNIPFARHFDPKLPLTQDVWYDRVHNIVLDVAVSSGILGLISYLSIFGVAIFSLLKTLPKIIETKNIFLPLGTIAALTVYFLQNMWVFDMISTYLMFFLSLAFVYFLTTPKETALPADLSRKKPFYSVIFPLLIIAATFAFYFGNIQVARVDRYITEGFKPPIEKTISIYEKTFKISPISRFEVPEQFSRITVAAASDRNSKEDKKVLQGGLLLAAKELEKASEKSPLDYRYQLVLARHYNSIFTVNQDQEMLVLAEKFADNAISLSPKNQQSYWTLAQVKLFKGDSDGAISAMQKAIDLEPKYAAAHWYMAMTYRAFGKYDLALEKVKDAIAEGYVLVLNLEEARNNPNYYKTANYDDIKKTIDIYQNLPERNDEELLALYEVAVLKSPEDPKVWGGQAITLANLGLYKEARESAEKAIALNPSFAKELESFLKSLPK